MSHVIFGGDDKLSNSFSVRTSESTEKGKGGLYISLTCFRLQIIPPALFSRFPRSTFLKRAILSSLPAVSAFYLDQYQMAPVTGRNERSTKLHSRVVGFFPSDPPLSPCPNVFSR